MAYILYNEAVLSYWIQSIAKIQLMEKQTSQKLVEYTTFRRQCLFQCFSREEILLSSVYGEHNYFHNEPPVSFTSVHVKQSVEAGDFDRLADFFVGSSSQTLR